MLVRRTYLAALGALAVALTAVSLAWACVPGGQMTLSQSSGPPGTQVVVTLSDWPSHPVGIYWMEVRPENKLATAMGPSDQKTITIPMNAQAGQGYIIGSNETQSNAHSTFAAPFMVDGGGPPPPPPPPPPDPPSGDPPPSGGSGGGGGGFAGPIGGGGAVGGRVINGTSGRNNLVGTPYADLINCGAGNDTVRGGGGNDIINCGPGRDRVFGGPGNDRIGGGSGNDRLAGNSGNDRLGGGRGNDRLTGGSGFDRLFGNSGRDTLFRQGNDKLSGGPGRDRILGGSTASAVRVDQASPWVDW